MEIKNALPGEEEELQKRLDKAREKYGIVPKKEKDRIAEQVHKSIERKEKVRRRFRKILAALGLSFAIGGTTVALGTIKDNNTRIEQETSRSQKHQEFTEQYRQEVGIKNEINNLKTPEEELKYMKELYIEAFKQTYPETTLTAEDIKITSNYEDYLFKNVETGEFITHGDFPDVTREDLKNNHNIEVIGYGDNEKIYKVKTQEGQVLDCMSIQKLGEDYKAVKVYIGDDYKENESVLTSMSSVITSGISYHERFEDEGEKQNFMKAVENWKEKTKEIKANEQDMEELEL